MTHNGTITGSPTFGAGKFGNGLTATSDANYIALPTGTFPVGTTLTIEAWLKTTATATGVAINSNNSLWMGVNASGQFVVQSPNTAGILSSGISINDGGWHHCALVITPTQTLTYVDGVAGASASVTFSGDANSDGMIGRYTATSFYWVGSIDEVAIWSVAQYAGSYTVPTAPYTGAETNLVALYHLSSDGTDSQGAAQPGGIDPSNPAILYSPFNWAISAGHAQTINSGAYLRTIFSGTSVSVTTDTSATGSPYPQLWVRIDGEAWVKFSLAAGNPTLTLATGLENRKHLLEVVVKSTTAAHARWVSPGTSVHITGFALDTGATVTAPVRRSKNILIYGDSITEGVKTVSGSQPNDVDNNDILCDYAYAVATACDAEVGIVGFGGTGILTAGVGSVPALPTTYNSIFSGVTRSFSGPAPDLVIYNEGTNDSASITAAFTGVVNAIRTAAPSSKHLLLIPFNGAHAADIAAVVAGIGSPNVTSCDTTGWFNGADSSDGLHPYGYAHLGSIAPKLFPVVSSILNPSGSLNSGYTFISA